MEKRLKAVWCGYGGNRFLVEGIYPIVKKAGYDLRLISEWEAGKIEGIEYVKWELESWEKYVSECDVYLAVQREWVQPAKSHIKVLDAGKCGLPVICSPLPAYLEIEKKYPGSLLIAYTLEDWEKWLEYLKDEKKRMYHSKRLKEAIMDYHISKIARMWSDLVLGRWKKVGVIVPTDYERKKKYVDLCIKSLEMQDIDVEIYLIDYRKEGLNYSQALNQGIEKAREEIIVLSNDDVIYTEGALKKMVEWLEKYDRKVIVGGISNCQYGWRVSEELITEKGIKLVPKMRIWEGFSETDFMDIFKFSKRREGYGAVEYDWIPFFSVMVGRQIFDEVGLLDKNYRNGNEDIDYCIRARKKGYRCIVARDVFIFHWGGVSRELDDWDRPVEHKEEDMWNWEYMKEKFKKPVLVFWAGGKSWNEWDWRTPEEEGIGGSESAVVYLSKYLSEKYDVWVFGNPKKSCDSPEGVKYRKWEMFGEWNKYNLPDYVIIERRPDIVKDIKYRVKVIVDHHDQFYVFGERFCEELIDRHFCRSKWHKKELIRAHGIPEGKISVIPNGINLEFYNKNIGKQRYKFIWASSWDRGLDVVLEMWERIKKRYPKAELVICYGKEGWEQAIKSGYRKGKDVELYGKVMKLLNQDGIKVVGKIGQRKLAEEFLSAEVMLFPRAGLVEYPEVNWTTFEIVVLEAMAGGCVVISSGIGALPETIGDGGIIIEGNPRGKEWQEKALEEVYKIFDIDGYRENWISKGMNRVVGFDWKEVVKKWEEELGKV